MSRVLIIESGDDWRALSIPEDWATDDVDRYLNGRAYGRAAVVTVEPMTAERCPRDSDWCDGQICADLGRVDCPHSTPEPDSFLPINGGEYGGGSV